MINDPIRVAKRGQLLSEFVTSETRYSEALVQFLRVFVDPVEAAIVSHQVQLQFGEIQQLFTMLRPVTERSGVFLEQLRANYLSQDDGAIQQILHDFPVMIVECFGYISRYHQLSPLYRKERLENQAFDDLCARAEATLHDSVPAFLILPVQRAPKYRFFLEELRASAPTGASDVVADSLDTLDRAISQNENTLGEFEEGVAKMVLQARLSGFEVDRGGRLLFHGDCQKFSRKSVDSRYLIVFEHVMIVAEPGKISASSLKIHGLPVPTGQYRIQDTEDRPPFINAVDVVQRAKSFRANMEDADQKRAILTAFENAIRAHDLNRVELLSQEWAPIWVPDEAASHCQCCGSAFSFLNRRHHCRAPGCGQVVCGHCFRDKVPIAYLDSKLAKVCPRCFARLKGQ